MPGILKAQQLIKQLGAGRLKREIKPSSFGVVIINSAISGKEAENAKKFLRNGGSLLTTFEFAKSIDGTIVFQKKFSRFLQSKGRVCFGSGLLWVNLETAVFQDFVLEKKIGGALVIATQGYAKKTG